MRRACIAKRFGRKNGVPEKYGVANTVSNDSITGIHTVVIGTSSISCSTRDALV